MIKSCVLCIYFNIKKSIEVIDDAFEYFYCSFHCKYVRDLNDRDCFLTEKPDPFDGSTDYVYVVISDSLVRMKIGYSTKPWKRLESLKTSIPDLEMLRIYQKADREDEKRLHLLLKKFSLGREWFELNQDSFQMVEDEMVFYRSWKPIHPDIADMLKAFLKR